MIRTAGRAASRSARSPVVRTAILTFAWNHRHEIMRWGRTLWYEVAGVSGVSPARTIRTGQVLLAVASDPELRNAPQLRRVTMHGDVVEVDVDRDWKLLPRLIQRIERVKGVERVVLAGEPIEATAR
jgi:hypothetical protein